MAATTTERDPIFSGEFPHKGTVSALAATKYLKGTMVAKGASGRGAIPVAATNLPIIGVAAATFDNTLGANDAMAVELEYGVFGFLISGAVPTVGDLVYALDNQTVTLLVGATNGKAGTVTEVRTLYGVQYAFVMISPMIVNAQ